MKPAYIARAALLIFLLACNNNPDAVRGPDSSLVYFDYKVTAEEDGGLVTCFFQYRMGGPEGTTMVVEAPGNVELDGETLSPDSANFTGAYYEVMKPLADFSGKHTIRFTDPGGQVYEEQFDFQPVTLTTPLPEVVRRDEDLTIELGGLRPVDLIRVVANDTSFTSRDINRLDTVRNGRLVITRDQFRKLENGPIMLYLARESTLPVLNGTDEGGRLVMNYSLQRIFTLEN